MQVSYQCYYTIHTSKQNTAYGERYNTMIFTEFLKDNQRL